MGKKRRTEEREEIKWKNTMAVNMPGHHLTHLLHTGQMSQNTHIHPAQSRGLNKINKPNNTNVAIWDPFILGFRTSLLQLKSTLYLKIRLSNCRLTSNVNDKLGNVSVSFFNSTAVFS